MDVASGVCGRGRARQWRTHRCRLNIWTVKAFSARARERERLAHEFGGEAIGGGWLYLERTRVLHDLCLWLMAGGMLVWAVTDGVRKH